MPLYEIEADVCVIGSGVAGGIVAQKCIDAGRKVLMLEAGRRVNGRALPLRLMERTIHDYRIPRMKVWHRKSRYGSSDYESIGNRGYGLRGLAVNARGGSTLGWIGTAYRLQPEDFRLSTTSGRGVDWPISYDELEPFYVEAERSLRVAGEADDEGHAPRSAPFPVAGRPFHTRDQPFLDLAQRHGWPAIHHTIALAPDGGAFTMDEILNRLEAQPDFSLLVDTVAERIVSSSSTTAAGVECRDGDGESFRVAAESVVVCAGGIETPMLLQRSDNEWWPEGLGNNSGHLGRHLMSHTGIVVGGRKGLNPFNGPIGSTAATRYFDSEAEQAAGKYLLLWYPSVAGHVFIKTTMEQFPTDGSMVSNGSGRTRFGTPTPVIELNLDDRQRERGSEMLETLKGLAAEVDLGTSHQRTYLNAHPMGTTRMSADPVDGVVDADLRVHTMDNVYVCGSSCFPSGGAANPTVTIAALAHRLGAHLAAG